MAEPQIVISPSDVERLYQLPEEFPDGCNVSLSAGTFALSRPVRVPTNTSMIGMGSDKTFLILEDRANCHIFTNQNHEAGNADISLARMSVDGNRLVQFRPDGHRPLTYACGIYFRRTQRVLVEDMIFKGVSQNGVHFNNSKDVIVRRVDTLDMGWSGLGTSRVSNLRIEHFRVLGAGCESTHSGIHLDGGAGNSITQSFVTGCSGNGIMLDSAFAPLSHCQVDAEVHDSFRGLSLSGKSQEKMDVIYIAGTYTKNREAGVMVSNATNVVLGDCDISDNEKYGVLLQGKSGARGCIISSRCKISNNGIDIAELHGSINNWMFSATSPEAFENHQINQRTIKEYSKPPIPL